MTMIEGLKSRSTKSHILVFLLGILTCIVSFRAMDNSMQKVIRDTSQNLTEPVPVAAAPINEDAACIARVLYGIRDYELTDKAKAAVVEIILNRVADTAREFRAYNTIQGVCNQENQWQGYEKGGIYLQEDYNLALSILERPDGARMIPADCFFLLVKPGEVIARTEFNGGNEWAVK